MSRSQLTSTGVFFPEAQHSIGSEPPARDVIEAGQTYYDIASNDNSLYYWDPERLLFLTTAAHNMVFFHDVGGAATLQLKIETAAFATSEAASIGLPSMRRMIVTELACNMPLGGPYTCTIQVRSQPFGGAAVTVGTLDFNNQNVSSRVDVNSANRIAANDIVTARVSAGTAGACFLYVTLRGYHEA